RVLIVTGVQTCALPISFGLLVNARTPTSGRSRDAGVRALTSSPNAVTLARGAFVFDRVERQGWDPEAAACVSVAMLPLDQPRAEIGRASCRERVGMVVW